MPRTRSAATPPPRRSGGDRSHSVHGLTHRPARSSKPAKKLANASTKLVKHIDPEQEEERSDLPETQLDTRQALIQRHAEVRAVRGQSGFGPVGIVAVALTCVAVFVAWWFLPDVFGKPGPIVPIVSSGETATSTVQFVPVSTTPTSTERRLLLPLTPSTSTERLK